MGRRIGSAQIYHRDLLVIKIDAGLSWDNSKDVLTKNYNRN